MDVCHAMYFTGCLGVYVTLRTLQPVWVLQLEEMVDFFSFFSTKEGDGGCLLFLFFSLFFQCVIWLRLGTANVIERNACN